MDEYRQATSVSNVNPAYTGEIGSRYAEQESFYSDERSFTNMEQPSMHSSYTEESGRAPRRYPQPSVPTYYQSPEYKHGGQPDQTPLFNYQPKWMRKLKTDSFSGGNYETTLEQSTYSKKDTKIKTYLPISIFLTVFFFFFPVGIVALILSLQIRVLKSNGETTLAKKRSRFLFWWILCMTTVCMVTYAVVVLVLLFCGIKDYSVDSYLVPSSKSAPYCIFGGGVRETYL